MFDDAVTLYLNGYLRGQDALLMATSNETASRLAALVRERLAELGRVGEAEITLSDGNPAGRGDLIRARLNTRIDADGQTLANRDVVRVESINDSGFGRLAAVRRQIGAGSVVAPVLRPGGLPASRTPNWPMPATSTSPRAGPSTAATWWSTAAPSAATSTSARPAGGRRTPSTW